MLAAFLVKNSPNFEFPGNFLTLPRATENPEVHQVAGNRRFYKSRKNTDLLFNLFSPYFT